MHQFYRIAAVSPAAAPGDLAGNLKSLKACYLEAARKGTAIVVFPGFATTGDDCGSMMRRRDFLARCRETTGEFASSTQETIAVFGTVDEVNGKAVPVTAVARRGALLAQIPADTVAEFAVHDDFTFAVASGEKIPCDVDADLLLLCGAEAFAAGARAARETQLTGFSASAHQAIAFANAGSGISTTDHVGDADAMIAVDGKILKRATPFAENEMIFADVDFGRIGFRREKAAKNMELVKLDGVPESPTLEYAALSRDPFLDEAGKDLPLIVPGAACALARRIRQIRARSLVLGVSGGLDSTLALIVCAYACDILQIPRENVRALTLPGFGTTGRTNANAKKLCRELGVSLDEIDISEACRLHLAAIGHDGKTTDAAYENSQARERTQILMDYANLTGGIVIGTGDLSELALGWCTYNGDQMSMYSVNATLPKTLMRHILAAEAEKASPALAEAIRDVLDTPVSPELLPQKNDDGNSSQQTESILGPYELHDFFLYHYISSGANEKKLLFLAQNAFKGVFDESTVRHTLENFLRRLFSQQFKRNPAPDGPQLTSVSLSPRGGWHIPSDFVK